jgi:hypothetical protein
MPTSFWDPPLAPSFSFRQYLQTIFESYPYFNDTESIAAFTSLCERVAACHYSPRSLSCDLRGDHATPADEHSTFALLVELIFYFFLTRELLRTCLVAVALWQTHNHKLIPRFWLLLLERSPFVVLLALFPDPSDASKLLDNNYLVPAHSLNRESLDSISPLWAWLEKRSEPAKPVSIIEGEAARQLASLQLQQFEAVHAAPASAEIAKAQLAPPKRANFPAAVRSPDSKEDANVQMVSRGATLVEENELIARKNNARSGGQSMHFPLATSLRRPRLSYFIRQIVLTRHSFWARVASLLVEDLLGSLPYLLVSSYYALFILQTGLNWSGVLSIPQSFLSLTWTLGRVMLARWQENQFDKALVRLPQLLIINQKEVIRTSLLTDRQGSH